MNDKTKRVLEYDKILELLSAQARSSMAKKEAMALLPSVDPRLILDMQKETTEAVSVILAKGEPPIGAFYDISDSLHLSKKGGTLTMRELLMVAYNLNMADRVTKFLRGDLPPIPIIKSMSEVLFTNTSLAETIDRSIVSEDEMSDNASSALKDIRRSIVRQNESLRAKMNQILSSGDNKTYFQDAIVTMRAGRYVIPVKQEHKGRFPGIVHDQSASGATLFIEPQVIVNLNNELRELEIAERLEIERILAALTQQVSLYYRPMLNNQDLLTRLDFIFAKGKLSLTMKAFEPIVSPESLIELNQARHPLIPDNQVVPVTITVGEHQHSLIITGPNTGGKTVTLKTTGLLCLMAQSGLHIPASSGSKLPVFKGIYADIGDEQSIEQSLSTFSSHMTNIVDLVDKTDQGTLVLLDELGAGTDPTEGAALAISILEDLAQRGAKILATTHYTELKKYALSTHGVENASMEFSLETLRPTYKLMIGIPGKSNAFEISRSLGLSNHIIEKAKGLIDGGELAFEDVIASLEEDKKLAEEERDAAIALKISMEAREEALREKEERLKNQRERILEEARLEAKALVAEALNETKDILKELRDLSSVKSLGERNRLFDEGRKRLKNVEGNYRSRPKAEEEPVKRIDFSPRDIKAGDRVKILSLDQNGHVITAPGDSGEALVQVGVLKVNVKVNDLMPIIEGSPQKAREKALRPTKYGSMYREKSQSVSVQINVQGHRLEDAVAQVDKYIDDASMAGLTEVTVIHGRGEGVLRKGIHQLLSDRKQVKSFRKGSFHEGGDGVTIVTLK